MILICIFGTLCVLGVVVYLLKSYLRKRSKVLFPNLKAPVVSKKDQCTLTPFVVGFFHPYCNAGGGGERVLWTAIRALQNRYEHFRCVIYTGDTDATREEILSKVQERFNILLPRKGLSDLEFVFLYKRHWVEASPYPVLTLLGQSIGSLVLGTEALWKYTPDIYIDTMGYAFTLPLFKYIGGCKIGCYVHYPTVSTDMLQRVSDRSDSFNNNSVISRSPFLTSLKLIYYKLFAYMYGMAGNKSEVIMVNSTWTYGHIKSLWQANAKTCIVYPPCDVADFLKIPLRNDSHVKQHCIVSLGQFRPEKDHSLQIRSFAAFLDALPNSERHRFKLILIGGCRNLEDENRVKSLKVLCDNLGVKDSVEFRLNIPFSELKQALADATIGFHTMWNEHFGIGVVECMAAGTIMLAHNSGGPKLDIVKDLDGQKTGYLAHNVETYSQAMRDIFDLSSDQRISIKTKARESVKRFSEEEFEAGFLSAIEPLLIDHTS